VPLITRTRVQGVLHSLILFFFSILTFQYPTDRDGLDNDLVRRAWRLRLRLPLTVRGAVLSGPCPPRATRPWSSW
jgi:hypothetical protein